MKKQFRLLMALTALFTLVMILPVSGQAPPPPAHGLNGNQSSPGSGASGCPLDRTDGILLALIISLSYSGFSLYQRGRKAQELR